MATSAPRCTFAIPISTRCTFCSKEINRPGIDPTIRRAAIAAFFHVIDGHRAEWQATLQQISEELGALRRAMEQQRRA